MRWCGLVLGLALAAPLAHAQPARAPAQAAPDAQALRAEGARQLAAQAYEQALANFLAAYATQPSPGTLLDIAQVLRAMGRLADAAETYQRYLDDPAAPQARAAEVRDELAQLDAQLAILDIRVAPAGARVSIDGGPFVADGGTLRARVRPGLHVVRVRAGAAASEITVDAAEGQRREVALAVPASAPPAPSTAPAAPERVDAWLVTGTRYTTGDPKSRERRVRAAASGAEVAAIVPAEPTAVGASVVARGGGEIGSGVIGVMRIDGEGRGFAGGIGVAYTPVDQLELELDGLRSDFWGAYVGARYRFRTGRWRPYAAAGVPVFFYTTTMADSRIAVGARVAAGLEVALDRHLSVAADLGVEHFFAVSGATTMNQRVEATLFVPTLGVIGRL